MNDSKNTAERYRESCRKEFWKQVFRFELDYLVLHLKGSRDVLSVGCGPAIIEGGLSEHGFHVTGLDISQEALNCAPDKVRTFVASAEEMPFPESSFDAAIYVASLQFIENYQKALERSASVLRPRGRIIVMLLNPEAEFFKEKVLDAHSYIGKIRHTNLHEIEMAIAGSFHIQTEYLMGVKQGEIFESCNPFCSVLYVIGGTKRPVIKKDIAK